MDAKIQVTAEKPLQTAYWFCFVSDVVTVPFVVVFAPVLVHAELNLFHPFAAF